MFLAGNANLSLNESPSFRTSLATTYEGGDLEYLEKIVPLVDYIEVVPDTLAESKGGVRSINQNDLAALKEASKDVAIIVHGVGLSIGSYDSYSDEYLRLLGQIFDSLDVAWHSEHIGYAMVGGAHLGTMLPMPTTEESLDLITSRVMDIRRRFAVPFLLENVAHVLPSFSENFNLAGFMNALVKESGCGLLLDIYNLECDAHNHQLNIEAFLDEINMDAIMEIHVANGVEYGGFKLDVHSDLVAESTLAYVRQVLDRAKGVKAVTYEIMSQAIPVLGKERVLKELERLNDELFPVLEGC